MKKTTSETEGERHFHWKADLSTYSRSGKRVDKTGCKGSDEEQNAGSGEREDRQQGGDSQEKRATRSSGVRAVRFLVQFTYESDLMV